MQNTWVLPPPFPPRNDRPPPPRMPRWCDVALPAPHLAGVFCPAVGTHPFDLIKSSQSITFLNPFFFKPAAKGLSPVSKTKSNCKAVAT